ncbi:Uncharacterised protein [uncultured archaeon]|nr:Uncharacterised protein [uncultured archaeon]
MALSTRDVSYPDGGVGLGQGWDSVSGEKKDIIGISFIEAKDTGQEKQYRIAHSTEHNKTTKELEVSAEIQYKYLTYSVGAKAKFADKVTTSGSFESFITWANVRNGVIYTAPVLRDQSALVTSLLTKGKTPTEINKALNIDSIEYSKEYPLISLPKSDSDNEKGIWLSEKAVSLAKENPAEFRRIYGDSFVSAIYGGAQLNVVMKFKTYSREKQEDITASMEGSGWGLDIKAEAVATMNQYADQKQLEIEYFQLGGNGDPMPTNVEGFLDKISELPKIAQSDPYNFKITLQRYDSLPNWPTDPLPILDTAYGQIVRRYYEYRDLYDEINFIKENSDEYILGKDIMRDTYPGITLKSLEDVQDELHRGMKDLLDLLQRNKGREDSAQYDMPQSASKPDYEFRIAMPIPLGYLSTGDLMYWNGYKETVCDKWVRPISNIRGKMYSEADPGCLTNEQIHQYESKVYYLLYFPTFSPIALSL